MVAAQVTPTPTATPARRPSASSYWSLRTAASIVAMSILRMVVASMPRLAAARSGLVVATAGLLPALVVLRRLARVVERTPARVLLHARSPHGVEGLA